MTRVRIPKAFYENQVALGLPAPPILRTLSEKLEIDAEHPDAEPFLEDARVLAKSESRGLYGQGLKNSAKSTVRAIEEARRA